MSMSMAQEYSEYVEAVVANASEMITAIEMTKEELIRTLEDENHGSVLQMAKEMKDSVIAEAYRGAMAPFMSPATEEREEEEGEAGSDGEREVRGERR
jgi:predicted phage tail protein